MKYKVLWRGDNFKVAQNNSVTQLGFYTTRVVEAETPGAAEHAAVKLVRDDSHLQRIVRNAPADPPMIYLDSLSEIASFDGSPAPGAGYTWFPDDGHRQQGKRKRRKRGA